MTEKQVLSQYTQKFKLGTVRQFLEEKPISLHVYCTSNAIFSQAIHDKYLAQLRLYEVKRQRQT